MIGRKNEGYLFPDPASLFRRRLWSHFKEIAAVVRSVVDDWTVLLYILIPGLLLGGRLYYGLWKEPLPEWSGQLPFAAVPVLLLLAASLGSILLLVREGDVLFLVQRKNWLHGIMLRSSLYSMVSAAVKTSICYLLLLPFLVRQFQEHGLLIGCLLAFTIAFEWVLMWAKHLIRVQRSGWRRGLLYIPFVFIPGVLYITFILLFRSQPAVLGLGAIVLAAISLLLIRVRLRLRGTFMNDVQEDLVKRTGLTSIALSQTVDKPRRIRRNTWVFSGSRPVFRSTAPVKRIAGAMIKTLLRHPKLRQLYVQFTLISSGVLITLPSGIQALVFVALQALVVYWLFLEWFSFRENAFVSLLPWPDDQSFQAGILAVRTLAIPFAVLTSAIVLFKQLVPWMAGIGFIPLAAAVCWVVPNVMRMFLLNKKA
ncbi:ABC transporter permease [Paenibacillus sp. KQZ6P-2]|uniref:ABC transporter permease n=1 Tax=Paenibacillus mangrovi TaxID=2931978 RepID=A0A9X1WNB4_9BACL|nr:ABC transporter permease [Paenibacillus mangrovi]MCJ8011766.1 ABC transporter permease [Paenibacillus mangrovi]